MTINFNFFFFFLHQTPNTPRPFFLISLKKFTPPPDYLQFSTNINSFVKVTYTFNPNASLHPDEKRQRPYRNPGSATDPMRHVLNGVYGVPGSLYRPAYRQPIRSGHLRAVRYGSSGAHPSCRSTCTPSRAIQGSLDCRHGRVPIRIDKPSGI